METTAGTTQYNTTITASNMASGNTGYQVVPNVWSSLEKKRKKGEKEKQKKGRKKKKRGGKKRKEKLNLVLKDNINLLLWWCFREKDSGWK